MRIYPKPQISHVYGRSSECFDCMCMVNNEAPRNPIPHKSQIAFFLPTKNRNWKLFFSVGKNLDNFEEMYVKTCSNLEYGLFLCASSRSALFWTYKQILKSVEIGLWSLFGFRNHGTCNDSTLTFCGRPNTQIYIHLSVFGDAALN